MPPKPPTSSKSLIQVGPRHLVSKDQAKKKASLRDENGNKPSTSRALILRGKRDVRGVGEALSNKITGRDKLEILAEDLVKQARGALTTKFWMAECLKIAESQYDLYLDDISQLRDNESFAEIIKAEVIATAPSVKSKKPEDFLKNPSHVATVINTKIHNTYMIASGWQLVFSYLKELQQDGLSDTTAASQLKASESMRTRYLALHKLVEDLLIAYSDRFSVLAMSNPHYASYFQQDPDDKTKDAIKFDKNRLREAGRSFVDSIIMELSFPKSPFPKYVLLKLLDEACRESRRDSKLFTQMLWDHTGDLSWVVTLKEIVDAPFFGPGQEIKNMPAQKVDSYDQWCDAQIFSKNATGNVDFKDAIYPLSKTASAEVLETMWKNMNMRYVIESGVSIDQLWGLEDAIIRTPQWHAFYYSSLNDESPIAPRKSKKPLAITNGGGDESDDSMPDLQSVSDSSERSLFDEEEDASDDDDDYESDESGYDTDQEDELRDMLRQAYEADLEADFLRSTGADVQTEDDRKDNPFLKLLGSLRGRLFSSNPKMSTTSKAPERPKGLFNRKAPDRTRTGVAATTVKPTARKSAPTTTKAGGVILEEVSDEDDEAAAKKKKKKKPKKKKKKKPTTEGGAAEVAEERPATPPPPSPPPPVSPKFTPASPTLSQKKTTPKKPTPKAQQGPVVPPPAFTLPVETASAQSSHSYLKDLEQPKNKVKTRADHASIFSEAPQKKSFLSRFGWGNKDQPLDETQQKAKRSWFSRLNKKTVGLAQTILKAPTDQKGRSSMKWDDFERFMKSMGFTIDPSTAGSSVRFDPPSKEDRAITFHKPHPDPTLTHNILTSFGKKLKDYYGWDEKDLITLSLK